MHILFTSDYLDPNNIGGAGRVLLELATRLAQRGHEISILAGATGSQEMSWAQSGATLAWRSFPYPAGRRRGVRAYAAVRRRARQRFRALTPRPDVIIHNQPLTADAVGDGELPALYFFHSPWPSEYLADRCGAEAAPHLSPLRWRTRFAVAVRRRIEQRAVARARCLVTLSHTMQRHAAETHRIPVDRIHVHAGGVDLRRFSPRTPNARRAARESLGIADGDVFLVCVRRLVPRTGVDLLLDAVAKLEGCRGLRVGVAGRGPLLEGLRGRARRLRISERVSFLGFVEESSLPDLYRAADLAVVPTRALEGFGLATLEALASGTPVVATPVGGSVEILEPLERRLLAASTDSTALARTLEYWLDNQSSLAALRDRCRAFVEDHYSWNQMADGIEDLAFRVVKTAKVIGPGTPPLLS